MLVLANVEWPLSIAVLQQVEELIVVDLQERAVDCEIVLPSIPVAFFKGAVVLLLDLAEDLFNRPWDDTQLSLILQEPVNVAVKADAPERVLARPLIVIPVLPKHRVSFP